MATAEQIAEFHQNIKPETVWQKIDLVILCFASIAPAMDLSGFGDVLPDWPLPVWLILSGMVGAFVGFTYYPRWRYSVVGIIPGMFAGPTVLLLTYFYTLPRETVYKAEMALVWLVALTPWAFVYYRAMRLIVLATSSGPRVLESSAMTVQRMPPPATTAGSPPESPVQAESSSLRTGLILGMIGLAVIGTGIIAVALVFSKGKRADVPREPNAWLPPATSSGAPATPPKAILQEDEINRLVADLGSAEKSVQRNAVQQLMNATPVEGGRDRVAAKLVEFLNDSDFVLRHGASQALATWGTSESVPALIESLNHNDFVVRRHAIESLGKLKDARAAEPLASRLTVLSDRATATAALKEIGTAAEAAVSATLDNPDVFLRLEACKILESIGSQESLSKLEVVGQDRNGLISSAARRAVLAINSRK